MDRRRTETTAGEIPVANQREGQSAGRGVGSDAGGGSAMKPWLACIIAIAGWYLLYPPATQKGGPDSTPCFHGGRLMVPTAARRIALMPTAAI